MSEPAVSIVVPTYNAERYLSRCLESLEGQTFKNFEIIAVNDFSKDNTLELLKEWSSRLGNMRIIELPENMGVSAARDAGVRAARGDFIGFVDADDWASPTMLATLVALLEETGADIAKIEYLETSCDALVENTKSIRDINVKVESGIDGLADMLLEENYALWNRLYRRELFDGDESVFPEGLTCEDRIANFKLYSRAKTVASCDLVEYYYFLNLGSISYNGLNAIALDLIEADRIMVKLAEELGDKRVVALAKDRAAKSAYSLLVRWSRFGTTDPNLDENITLRELRAAFEDDYERLMHSKLSFPKKAVAWQLRHCPSLLKTEFKLHNALSSRRARS